MTHFLATLSVDAWDAWFRWRAGGELRDRTIDATWQRVADAIASVEVDAGETWAQRFVDAFAQWQMLPDERMLQAAGTDSAFELRPAPVAVLNVRAFVAGHGEAPGIDCARIAKVAALAVRALDDALLLTGTVSDESTGLHIGVIGMADAIAQSGMDYDSDGARELARRFALAMQEGCLAGAIALAAERGATACDMVAFTSRLREAGVDGCLIADALRWGVRHRCCTAINLQPRLALLANDCSDALDPARPMAALAARAQIEGMGIATLNRPPLLDAMHGIATSRATAEFDPHRLPDPIAQLRLRAAVQPHIDHPIDYPLLSLREPAAELRASCAELAARAALPVPRWRVLEPRSRAEGN